MRPGLPGDALTDQDPGLAAGGVGGELGARARALDGGGGLVDGLVVVVGPVSAGAIAGGLGVAHLGGVAAAGGHVALKGALFAVAVGRRGGGLALEALDLRGGLRGGRGVVNVWPARSARVRSCLGVGFTASAHSPAAGSRRRTYRFPRTAPRLETLKKRRSSETPLRPSLRLRRRPGRGVSETVVCATSADVRIAPAHRDKSPGGSYGHPRPAALGRACHPRCVRFGFPLRDSPRCPSSGHETAV